MLRNRVFDSVYGMDFRARFQIFISACHVSGIELNSWRDFIVSLTTNSVDHTLTWRPW